MIRAMSLPGKRALQLTLKVMSLLGVRLPPLQEMIRKI
jgi:hypothetical protein